MVKSLTSLQLHVEKHCSATVGESCTIVACERLNLSGPFPLHPVTVLSPVANDPAYLWVSQLSFEHSSSFPDFSFPVPTF